MALYAGPSFILNLIRTSRFVDRDAFARLLGIGIGCQRLQATKSPEIVIGPDVPEPMELAIDGFDESLFDRCYKFDDDDNAGDGLESS